MKLFMLGVLIALGWRFGNMLSDILSEIMSALSRKLVMWARDRLGIVSPTKQKQVGPYAVRRDGRKKEPMGFKVD